jgi:carbonic anhydrase/acetyltransferase-like protein (isoleucine patch superfamily)
VFEGFWADFVGHRSLYQGVDALVAEGADVADGALVAEGAVVALGASVAVGTLV